MIIVLDANAGIEIVLNRSKSSQLKESIVNCRKVISTDLYKAEITNTLWQYIKAGLISKEKGIRLLKLAGDLVDEYSDIGENNNESLVESVRLNHSSYDMLYFTLARRTGGVLLTLDKKLLALAEKEGIETVKLT
jgi:predicted nucleic acid-binding protein